MAGVIYLLCALTALACAWMLFHNYRRTRYNLLFWSALCFAGLTVNNLILMIDKLLLPEVSLFIWREGVTLVALSMLVYGLVWEME